MNINYILIIFMYCDFVVLYGSDNNTEKLSVCATSELELELKDQDAIENDDLLFYLPNLKSEDRAKKDADIQAWKEYCAQQTQKYEAQERERKEREKIVHDMIYGSSKGNTQV